MPYPQRPDPQEDRLNKLAAIAQIYGHLSGPQFQQEELGRQQDQQRQQLMLALLQHQQLQQYQQQELQQRAAALAQEGTHQQSVLDLTKRDFDAREADRQNNSQERQKQFALAENDRAYNNLSRDPRNADALQAATLDQSDSPFIQKFANAQHKGYINEAQNVWNTQMAPSYNSTVTPEARTQLFNSLQQKYGQAFNSGEVDFSQGFPTTTQQTTTTQSTPAGAGGAAYNLPHQAITALGNVGQSINQGLATAGNYSVVPVANFLNGLLGMKPVPYYNPNSPTGASY